MTDPTPWKKALQEPNALGWIAFLVLVIAIGAGVLYFGGDDRTATSTRPAAADHAARR